MDVVVQEEQAGHYRLIHETDRPGPGAVNGCCEGRAENLRNEPGKASMRKPDFVINGPGIEKPYLSRWWIIPRNAWFNIYLHKFERSDDDRALHDHPWYSVSFLLKGEMVEHSFKGLRFIPRFLPIFRTAKFAHRLELVKGPVWTIFITGPRIRTWGFYCAWGWRPWEEFTSLDGTTIEKGCD